MCRLPVTFGGGIMIVYGVALESGSQANEPRCSQPSYRRVSISAGLYVLSSISLSCGLTRMPQKADDGNTTQGTTRPTTRSISARTKRSTRGGRCTSSHSFSNGRISSRTRSSMVGPPLRTCEYRSAASVCTRLQTEEAAAAAASGATRPVGGGTTTGTAGCSDCIGGSATGVSSTTRVGSGTIILGSSTSTPSLGSTSGLCGGEASAGGVVSSSLRIRRIEARISSIDGSPAVVDPAAPAAPWGDCAPLMVARPVSG